MSEVAGSLKGDFEEKLEVEMEMLEEKVPWLDLVEKEEEWKTRVRWDLSFVASSEECLDGWVRASGGEVKGGGIIFRISRILLGVIPGDIMGKAVVNHLELMKDSIDNRWVVRKDDKEGTMVKGWRNNMDGH
uniref:Uncharacterized protein n=1 Tax=Tanacetum cinerariifolium TaxID=118510 RepID=A0A699GTJ1_TANCI|nr:hypothetical protein [Tanacetum cinerariifolium]